MTKHVHDYKILGSFNKTYGFALCSKCLNFYIVVNIILDAGDSIKYVEIDNDLNRFTLKTHRKKAKTWLRKYLKTSL